MSNRRINTSFEENTRSGYHPARILVWIMSVILYHLGSLPPAVLAFEIKIPLPPGEWRVTRGVNGPGFHQNSFAIDFDDAARQVNVLASLSGSVFRVVRDVCDAEGRDVCTYCSKNDEGPGGIAVYYDSQIHSSYNDFGNHVIIDHADGYRTVYAHLRCGSIPPEIVACSSLPPERLEECKIRQGEVLGIIGTSGASSGTHLHMEVRYKVGTSYSVDISVPELQVATMEGRLLSEYTAGKPPFTSTNRPGLELIQFSLDGVPNVITSAGFHGGTVSYTIRNNADETRYIGAIEVKGVTEHGGNIQSLDVLPVAANLEGGFEMTESRTVNFEIPDDFVGNFRIFATYTDENSRETTGNLTDTVFCVADADSILIDDSHTDFSFNTEENVETYATGGADGQGVHYTYSNFDNIVGTWRPASLQEGRYELLVYVPSPDVARASTVNYEIIGTDQLGLSLVCQSMPVNQLENAGRWISLGRHYFNESYKEVTLTPVKLNANYKVGFDAVLFRYSGELDDFGDIDSQDWFYTSVNTLQDFGIVRGRQGNLFEPSSRVTRAEMLKMAMEAAWLRGRPFFAEIEETDPGAYLPILFALKGLPYPPFSDVTSIDEWYFLYVNLGFFYGIVNGNPDGSFGPNDFTQRVEAMKMIVEAFDFDLAEGQDQTLIFTDVTPGEWYIPYLKLLNRFEIVHGYPDGTVKPGEFINRAEAAALIAKTIEISDQIDKR